MDTNPTYDPLMPEKLEVTEPQAGEFLASLLGQEIENLHFLASGAWSKCFAFENLGDQLVVRFGRHFEDFAKDEIAGHYTRRGLPVPRVLHLGEAFGGYFAISERVYGVPIEALDEQQWREILPNAFATLDIERAVEISNSIGYGMWDSQGNGSHRTWKEYLLGVDRDVPGERISGWRDALRNSPKGEGPYQEALSRLNELVGYCPEIRTLVHSDLHLNMLVQDGNVTGVIDWGCSLYGDFLYEHARFAFLSTYYEATKEIDFIAQTRAHLESQSVDLEHFEERMLAYQIHVGLQAQIYEAFINDHSWLALSADRLVSLIR
jgi:hygromycin-B 4-O-kinase